MYSYCIAGDTQSQATDKSDKETERKVSWVKAVKRRDKYTCQSCFTKEGTMVAHHLNNYLSNPKVRTELSNGITLCEKCHRDFHKWKGGWYVPCDTKDFYIWSLIIRNPFIPQEIKPLSDRELNNLNYTHLEQDELLKLIKYFASIDFRYIEILDAFSFGETTSAGVARRLGYKISTTSSLVKKLVSLGFLVDLSGKVTVPIDFYKMKEKIVEIDISQYSPPDVVTSKIRSHINLCTEKDYTGLTKPLSLDHVLGKNAEKIFNELKKEPKSQKEMVHSLSMNRKTFYTNVKKLIRFKLVSETQIGSLAVYSITKNWETTLYELISDYINDNYLKVANETARYQKFKQERHRYHQLKVIHGAEKALTMIKDKSTIDTTNQKE